MNEQSKGTIVCGSLAGGLGATIAGGNFGDGFSNGAISGWFYAYERDLMI